MSETMISAPTHRFVIGVGDMKLSNSAGDLHVTHALGSCLGISIYDPVAVVGGLLHIMLPESSVNPVRAAQNPWVFADTGIPRFFKAAYDLGAQKSRLVVKVAGGAQFLDKGEFFAIGKRNHTAMRKLFWQNGILVKAEHVGGTISRTMYLELGSGRVWFTTGMEEIEL
jgi:chemotaxis protein CheD